MIAKIGRKTLSMSAALILVLINAGTSFAAGPVSEITIKNNWSEDATVAYGTQCVGSVSPAFDTINSGSSSVNTVRASIDGIFSCSVKYRKGRYGPRCEFVISRLTNISFFGSSWKYPQVVIYKDSGADCKYTFTSVEDTGEDPNTTNGNFNVTLEMK